MKKHWALNYLGLPYIKGEQDCWTVFCEIQNDIYKKNIQLTTFGNISELSARREFQQHPLRQRFKQIKLPIEGCAVFLGRGKYTSHIGTFINSGEGKVIHSLENTGVLVQTLSELQAHGWNIKGFYKVV